MRTIIVDSDALIALVNKDDKLATRALRVLEGLHKQGAKLLYPVTTIAETTTTLQRKLGNPLFASEIMAMTREFMIVPVDQETLELAESIFEPMGSKQNTLFDAIVAAIAQKLKADAVFSFDSWYEKVGLTLVEHLDLGNKTAK